MASGLRTVIYPVKDVAQAKTLFEKLLGVAPYADEAYYAASGSGTKKWDWTPTATARA